MGFFTTLFIYVFLFLLSEILRPKQEFEDAKPAGLGDFQFPTATEGRVVPIGWGTWIIKGPNVVWYGDLIQDPIEEKIKTGLFSSETVIKGYKYKVGIQFALCRGVDGIDELLRVWVGETEIFNGSVTHDTTFTINKKNFFGGDDLGNGGLIGTMRFFEGNNTQSPSSYLSSGRVDTMTVAVSGSGYAEEDILTMVGGTGTAATARVLTVGGSGEVLTIEMSTTGLYTVNPPSPASTNVSPSGGTGCTLNLSFGAKFQGESGKTPAYRGTCYLAPDTAPIYVGNSSSIKPWWFEIRRIPDGLVLGAAATVNGNDANPMNVIYEIMTNTEWGLSFDPSTIDVADFSAAGTTLKLEGNGFSFHLDRPMEASELIKLVEQQIDGVVFQNQLTGQWQVNLARFDYDPDLVPEINASNLRSIDNFSRAAWQETTNEIRVQFNDRDDEYKTTYGFAQDLANIRVMQGTVVTATQNFPGVKDATLANQIAWRSLRGLSYPLAKATLVVDRTFYDVQPGSVVTFTDEDLNFTKLPMRVTRIDLGELADGRVTLDLVQDIYAFQLGAFGDPTGTGWTAPGQNLLPFLAQEQLAFEAPRAFVFRDPKGTGAISDKIYTAARRRGGESTYEIVERHVTAPSIPTGSFADVGGGFLFMLVGELNAVLDVGSAYPLTTLLITPDPDSQTDIEEAFVDGVAPSELGINLVHLMLVGDEFISCEGAQISGGNVQLDNVYRGLLDSVQADHPAGTKVYLIFQGGSLADNSIAAGQNVHVKLLPSSPLDTVAESAATQVAFEMDNRVRRPYPPSLLDLGSTNWPATAGLETNGSDGEDYAIDLNINRRDFRTAEGLDEVEALTTDAATLFPTFPALNSTDQQVDVRADPDGANTFLFTSTFTAAQEDVLRILILKATLGVLPTRLRFVLRSRHTEAAVLYSSRQELTFDFNVTSDLTGDFNFGALDNGDISNVYTATVAGTYAFTLSSSFTSGDVEYRVNGGSWTTLIAAGGTGPGNIAGVLVSDTIEVRHLGTDTTVDKFLTMAAAGAGQDGYAVLYT